MIVVSDTSAISNLYQIGLIDVLKDLYGQIVISPGVHHELSRVQAQADFLFETDWIIVKHPTDQLLLKKLLDQLDLGESESIVLAIELKAEYLIIDERLGRSIATEYGIQITGILGVLIQAKKLGLIDNVSDKITALREIGLWLNDKLIKHVLDSLGEI
ncbi:DUF3368 domain-containing protein [Lewinella sp. 4G2]|uniref:DUF3368 domain-containing protein n=1 Tax=Lewinella sp. 4G2 TaxID=1803372 RepID=UPI0007B48E93|nr:DUF3368 domain-containing protein [Lewinella sp. 4G2]OAV44241.1 hypothetical protein A3850_006915 [Lewinella sp. 4G2]